MWGTGAVMLQWLLLALSLVLSLGLAVALVLLRSTISFSASAIPYVVLRTGVTEQETRPLSDAVFHVLFFKWRLFGSGRLYQRMLRKLNRAYDDWDTPFDALGLAAGAWVREYCDKYRVEQEPWPWSKNAAQYLTKNEWFTRKHKPEFAPEANLGTAQVVAPATAVVTFFPSVLKMPRIVKNDRFTIAECGLPDASSYETHPCLILYLAPADYHCYHAPIGGRVSCLRTLGMDTHSASVKQYIYEHINILAVNRRAVIVIQCAKPLLRCAMVVIGGVTVDSIRLEPSLQEGCTVERGQLLGCFARGGSSVALFFDRDVHLVEECLACQARAVDFKLDCGASLANVCG